MPSGTYRIRTNDPEARPSEVTKVARTEPTAEEALVERVVQEVLRRLGEQQRPHDCAVDD